MNTDNLHITKYIRVMVLMLLTLWCDGVVGQTFEGQLVEGAYQKEIYVKSSEISVPYQPDLWQYIDEICSELSRIDQKTVTRSDLNTDKGIYIRWSVENLEKNVVTDWTIGFDDQYNKWPYGVYNGYYYWFKGYDQYESVDFTIDNPTLEWPNTLLKPILTPPNSSSFSYYNGYQLVCYITNESDGCNGQYSFTSEPNNLKIKYTIIFNETGEAPIVDNFSNVPSNISSIEKEVPLYEALSPTSASITLDGATAPSYIRWYFADASGNAVANPGFTLSNEGYTYTSHDNSIYYGGTTTETNNDLLSMTVTPQSGKSWSDLTPYKLVALLSNEVGTTDDNGTLIQEPLIATKYEISFDYVTFASELPDNQHTLDIEVTDANAQTATIALSEQWEQIKSDLGAETVTYMKYYWLDGNNSIVQTGSLTGNISFSEHPLAGMHWLKSGEFSTDMLDFTASVTSGVITDYKLVILLSDEEATYDENNTWVKEPTLQSMYTVSFYAPRTDFDGSLVNGGISKAVEVTYEYGATKVQVGDANDATDTYSLVYDWGQNTNSIQSLFNYITQSGDNWSTNVYYPNYRRAYVRNKKTQELLANQDKWLTWTPYYLNDDTQFNYNALFYNEKGEFWTKSYAQYRQGNGENNWEWAWFNGAPYKSLLAVTVNLPEGTDLTFEDIEVVVILAKKDAERETHSSDVHTVDLGPDGYEVEYVYSFKKGDAPFENVPEGITDYPGSKSIHWKTTQPVTINLADYCTADDGQSAITYVRYLLTDKSGNEVPWNNAGVTLTAPNGYTFTAQGNSQYIYQATATSNLLTVNLQATTLANLQNYNLKAYVSTQTADIATIQREPEIETVYTVSFDMVTFENTVSATEYKTINIYEEQSYTTILVDLGGTAPTYVRWYWSSDGNSVTSTDWTFGNTAVTFTDYNGTKYHYAGTTANEELNKLTITPPVGIDAKTLPSTGLKLIALVSTKTENDGAQTENGELIKEPFIDTKYIISFETVGFEGSVANSQSLNETIRLEDAAMSSVTLSLPLSSVAESMGKEESSFYIRYYLTDKSGNRVALPDGVTITPKDNSITLTSNNYGHYWYSSTGIGSISDLEVTVADANSAVDLRNYNVVVVMSSNAPLQVTDGIVTYEPREMEVVYTYELKKPISNDFDGDLASGGIRVQKLIIYEEGTASITLTDVRDDWDNLKDLFEPNSNYVTNSPNGAKTPRYRRVYVRHKETKELLNWIVDTDVEHFNVSEYGHIWTAKYDVKEYPYGNYYCWFDPANSKFLTTTIKVPDGSSLSLLDVEVVFILAQGDAREENTDTWTITKGPEEHEVEYNFNFMSEKYLPFVHCKGVTGRDWETVSSNPLLGKFENQAYDAVTNKTIVVTDDIRQGTHEWTYEIYVEPGATKALFLPLQDVLNFGNQLEPQGYFRWYNWDTDFESDNIEPFNENNTSVPKLEKRFYQIIDGIERSRGWIAWWWGNEETKATANNVAAVNYNAPDDNNWEGETIACDVSKYIDGLNIVTENNQTSIGFVHEPTLSYRYKYVVRPASVIADAIDAAIAKGSVLEDHGNVTIGIYSLETEDGYGGSYWERGGTTTLRLERNSISNYYFNVEGIGCLQSTSLEWSVYNAAGDKVADLSPETDNPTFCKLAYNSSLYKIGEFYSVKVYACANDANGQKHSKEIARFNCKFLDNSYVMGFDDIPTSRTISYLEENYTRVGLISFDIEEGSTLDAPTNQLDNINPMPFKWQRSHYGYCYGQLYDKMAGKASVYAGLGALHGDYRLVKSANVASKEMTELWHVGNVLHDRTYETTEGMQHGYFLYIDASDESRPIANVEFEGEMCVGSTLVLSAAVANMTGSSVKPQLIFKLYGIKTDIKGNETERKLIHSFATCDFSTVKATETAIWYQTYAKVTLQTNSGVENYQQFLVSIDNYCDGTNGADYAIDDIRIYTQNAKVDVKQDAVLCGNDKLSVKLMMKHETLLAMMPSVNPSDYPMPVYYRFCEEDGTPVAGADFYGSGLNDYGQVDLRYYFYDPSSSISEEATVGAKENSEELAHHYQKTADGARYFMLSKVEDFSSDPIKYQTYALEPGKKYYVSVAVPEVKTDEKGNKYYVVDEHSWGAPTDVCSMYSNPFEPMMQNLKLLFGGVAIDRISVTCGQKETDVNFELTGALQIPDEETGQMVSIENPASCRFDWIVEEKTNGYTSVMTPEFKEAWDAFRYRKGETVDDTPMSDEIPASEVNETFTEGHRTLLNGLIAAKKLHLLVNATLKGYSYEVGKTYIITALPLDDVVKQTVNGVEKSYTVCPEPMEVTVEARLDGPELDFGFEAVNYESVGMLYGAEGLRVGLDYLEHMQTGQIPLHIPINSYKIGGTVQTDYDVFLDETGMIVVDSNDPSWSGYLDGTHRIAYETDEKHQIDEATKSMEVYFHPKFQIMDLAPENKPTVSSEGDDIKFHEGYWYMVKVKYVKEESELQNLYGNRCYGESLLTIKVVPKYMTWGEGLPNNSNWLNDANWRRSSKEELYKVKVNTDNYPVYGDTNESDEVLHQLSNKQGFVPMKFTKVTILSDMPSPYPFLSNLVPNVHTGIIDKQYMYNGDNSAPTADIEYDMMVKTAPETCPYKVGTTDLVYECEHFYGNICDEIYFKPRAQLRYQHYLDYKKAWVEMELSANKWMMLTSPFVQMYAGDFYVPAVEEGGAYPYGRQETEAFQDIIFKNKSQEGGIYSRNGYPIYQRSWDKTNSMVVTSENDALRNDYDAFIDYEWAEQITSEAEGEDGNSTTTTQTVVKDVNVVATQWSHVYNDMTKLYEPGRGFSVRLHHTDQLEEDGTDENVNTIYKDKKALLRFPKADTEYTYYDHADAEGHSVKVDKSNHHRLAADGVATGMVQITPVANANADNPYYMVGNPYMASVRMELFFNTNPHLVKTYWVVSNGVPLSATEETGLGIIGPMQSFFVKAKDGGQVTDVLFSPAMTVSHLVSGAAEIAETDGEAGTISFTTRTTDAPMARTRVILSAEADNGFADEEDVETLLDSNLGDVPMVYTVAGTQAAMVNRLNDLTLLPLGVFGKEGETVDVQVSGVDGFGQKLYFYDASTGRQALLEEGASLALEANVHGRYFLTTRALEEVSEEDTDWQVRCYSLQRGELIVATMPQDNLRQVRIYGVNGRQVVNDATAQSNVSAYALPAGIYVVEVVTERMSRPQAVKVVVR